MSLIAPIPICGKESDARAINRVIYRMESRLAKFHSEGATKLKNHTKER